MKPSELKILIKSRFQANIRRALLVEGAPGCGKTQIPEQVAQECNEGFMKLHCPMMPPEDFGIPVVSTARDNVTFIVSSDKFPLEGSKCPERGILLLDEIAQADNALQKVLANLIQEREIHGRRIKDGWTIICTGNRITDRAGANRLLSHLRNKLTTITLDVSLDDWTQWALANGVPIELIGFFQMRPDLLNTFDPKQLINATPRSWTEGVGKMLGVVSPEHELEVFSGDVGEGPAAEFCGYMKVYRKLPSPNAIIINPLTTEVPTEPSICYALCGALARKTTPDNFGRIMQYVNRMAPEFAVLFVKDCLRRDQNLANNSDFIAWSTGKGAALLAS